MEIKELLDTAASPHLIASASKAVELMAELNVLISDLRLSVSESELVADLELNSLLNAKNEAIERCKAQWRVGEAYKTFKSKAGQLADVRALRRNLERHIELLSSQERFGKRYENKAQLG